MKKKYSIDLAGQMAECEANYARLMRLLPDLETTDSRLFGVAVPGGIPVQLHIRITERCRYTTMLDISQRAEVAHEQLSRALQPTFSIRIYHDARMAEVVACDQHRQIFPLYEYPNENMFQQDEKARLNHFLGEWLSHCLKYGHEVEDLASRVCSRI